MQQLDTNPFGPPAEIAGAVLTIRLDAIQENWRRLAARTHGAECGAAIKGDAYGLGVAPVARALWAAGCRSFFVARPMEGAELRAVLPEAVIYVLDGLFPDQAEFYAKIGLRPALISVEEAREWAGFGRVYGRKLPCALHIDTGINRLGLSVAAFDALMADAFTLDGLDVALVMSHLACAEEPDHPLNARQQARFAAVRERLPGVPASLANSGGIFLGAAYIHDLVRPGIALYGGRPVPGRANAMAPVIRLEATVLQTRDVAAGEPVGYGATWAPERPSRIAVLGAGYKDGMPRSLGSGPRGGPAQVLLCGRRCPVVGRISMDMMAVDVTGIPAEDSPRGARAELIGDEIGIDEAAGWAGTVSYELLTRLGSRYARHYAEAFT